MSTVLNRRNLLRASGAAVGLLATPTFFVRNAWSQDFTNNPGDSPVVKFGFNVPQTGSYADEGADELRAYELAVKHINEGGGMLETIDPLALGGNGVLGKKVEFVTGDTQTNADAARESARRMIERDGVVMFSGGSSSSVAVAQQYLAQELGVVFMCGLTHSNDTTGKDRRRYGFRHMFNAHMTGLALGSALADAYGKDRMAYHLTADYNWGHSQYESIKAATEAQGWQTANNIMTPLGAGDFSQFITSVLASDADVLVLNHYGRDMVNSLTQAIQFGMRDLQKNGKDFQVVVPLYSRLMASGAGSEAVADVFGTTNWNWALAETDAGSKAFVDSFEAEYGFPPSQAAHTCYVQALMYADACERAGTFNPTEVIATLEGHAFTGTSPGEAFYRAEDHQCFKDILVVRGKRPSERENDHDFLAIVNSVERDYIVDNFAPDLFPGDLDA